MDSRPNRAAGQVDSVGGGQRHRPGDRHARRPPPGAARDQGEGVAQGQVVAAEQVAVARAAALEREPVAAGHVGGGDHVDPRPRQVGADPAAHVERDDVGGGEVGGRHQGYVPHTASLPRIYITGHRNPDADSIASAIGYAELKGRLDPSVDYVPVRLGDVNAQTRWLLDRSGAPLPVSCPTSCCASAT